MLKAEIIRKTLLRGNVKFTNLNYSTTAKKSETSLEEESLTEIDDETAKHQFEEIERKRNKSRLRVQDRNLLLEENPYTGAPFNWHLGTLKYKRRLFGRYGNASGVDPSLCWPVKEELDVQREYEQVAYPYTINEVVKKAAITRQEKAEKNRLRQLEIVKKMEKLEEWKVDLQNRIAKKEGEAMAEKERTQRIIEKVRMSFGYTIDPKDEKFKERLEKIEREEKKIAKEERRKARDAMMMSRLLSKKTDKGPNQNEGKDENIEKAKE